MSHVQSHCVAFHDFSNVKYAKNVYIEQVTEPEGAGEGLFFLHVMRKGDILGIYENVTGGQRLTSGRIKSDTHQSDYADEHEGLVRDAWDPVPRKPCHRLGYANDSLDIARDNMALYIHPDRPKLLLMILTRDVQADGLGFVSYGGLFFCNDKYPLDVLIKTVRRYNIDIGSSTDDTDGNWKGLVRCDELLASCPSSSMTSNENKRKVRPPKITEGAEKFFLLSTRGVAD